MLPLPLGEGWGEGGRPFVSDSTTQYDCVGEQAMKEQIWAGKGRGQAPDAIKANGFIFLSAIRGEDPKTRSCDTDDVGEQARFALENVKTVLAVAGATLND